MVLANVKIDNNGAGISNSTSGNAQANVVLVNVSITGNRGPALSNGYEGAVESYQTATGSLNVLLTNVRITGNNTGSYSLIYNTYSRYSGYGIQLTLDNVTIAGNTSSNNHLIYNQKYWGTPPAGKPVGESESGDLDRVFPVYMRFRNSVVYNNTKGNTTDPAIGWGVGTSALTAFDPTDRQSFSHSLIQDSLLSDDGNIPDSGIGTVFGSNYRPIAGGVLSHGNANDYPNAATWPSHLFWKPVSGSFALPALTMFVSETNSLTSAGIDYFLSHDNSFNVGDPRTSGETASLKSRPSGYIGAYEP
jgi:hypothetical protein